MKLQTTSVTFDHDVIVHLTIYNKEKLNIEVEDCSEEYKSIMFDIFTKKEIDKLISLLNEFKEGLK